MEDRRLTPCELVARLARRGVELRLHGDELQSCGPLQDVPAELRKALRRRTDAVCGYLAAETAWASAIADVSSAWDQSERPDWLGTNEAFTEAVGDALRSDDPRSAFAAIEKWRSVWLRSLKADPGRATSRHQGMTPE